MTASITLSNLTLTYQRHPAVHHVSGEFRAGSLTAIAGPNGAGKSTLLKAIAGILPIHEGHLTLQGASQEDIAYLPQAADIQTDFPLNVLQFVTSGLWKKRKSFVRITSHDRDQAAEALKSLGLHGFETRTLNALSAGQFQRVLFARTLVQDAPILLLDEPFTAVDAPAAAHLLDVILQWHAEKRTVLCVLHDFEQIQNYFPECLLLARECIAWGNTTEVLKSEYLLSARFFREAYPAKEEICDA